MWCSEWGRNLCKIPHSCCSQNTKHRKLRALKPGQKMNPTNENLYMLRRQLEMNILFKLYVRWQHTFPGNRLKFAFFLFHLSLEVKDKNTNFSWNPNAQKFTESKTWPIRHEPGLHRIHHQWSPCNACWLDLYPTWSWLALTSWT